MTAGADRRLLSGTNTKFDTVAQPNPGASGKSGTIPLSQPPDDRLMKNGPNGVDILDFRTVVEKLADQQKLSEIKVRKVVRGLVAVVAEGLKNGQAVRIGGLGVLRVRNIETRSPPIVGGKARKAKRRVVLSPAKKFNIAVDLG